MWSGTPPHALVASYFFTRREIRRAVPFRFRLDFPPPSCDDIVATRPMSPRPGSRLTLQRFSAGLLTPIVVRPEKENTSSSVCHVSRIDGSFWGTRGLAVVGSRRRRPQTVFFVLENIHPTLTGIGAVALQFTRHFSRFL